MKQVILPRKDRIQGLLALSVDDALVGLVDIHLGLKNHQKSIHHRLMIPRPLASGLHLYNIYENVIAKQLLCMQADGKVIDTWGNKLYQISINCKYISIICKLRCD